jgi:hypothetical protein
MKDWLGGHFHIGKNITVFGRNAMHWGVNIHTKKYGYICFRLPFLCFSRWWPLYLYFSPNATPWAATFMIGGGKYNDDRKLAPVRRQLLGHNFDSENDRNYALLKKINGID